MNLQTHIDNNIALGNKLIELPAGDICVENTIIHPEGVHFTGNVKGTTLIVTPLLGNNSLFVENYPNISDYYYGKLKLSNFTIIDARQKSPPYLSSANGQPITHPADDYLPFGCLSPQEPATLELVVSNGSIVQANVVNAGSGYSFPPMVWVDGDGYGGRILLTVANNSVTKAFIADEGWGYTNANAIVAGGGANVVTALFNNNRRNPNYVSSKAPLIKYSGIRDIEIDNITFINHEKFPISLSGCIATIKNSTFINVGKYDEASGCLWAGPLGNLPSEILFTNNNVESNRLVCSIAAKSTLVATHNKITKFTETAFFFPQADAIGLIENNIIKNGFMSDIVVSAVEATGTVKIRNNIIANIDGSFVAASGPSGGMEVSGNIMIAPAVRKTTRPFGPFGERVSWGVGGAPVAGAQIVITERAAITYTTQTNNPSSAPKYILVEKNELKHISSENGFKFLLSGSCGAKNAQSGIIVTKNSAVNANGCQLLDTAALNKTTANVGNYYMEDNIGFYL